MLQVNTIYTSIKDAVDAAERAGAKVDVKRFADGDYMRATAEDDSGIWWLTFQEVNGMHLCTWRLVKVAKDRRIIGLRF